eukprot:2715302-Pyramimonas_sp.AAC.1
MEVRPEGKGDMERAMRLRPVMRGFMDVAPFDVEAFSGAAQSCSWALGQRVSAQEGLDSHFI